MVLPGYPGMRIISTAAFSQAVRPPLAGFIETLVWLIGLLLVVTWILSVTLRTTTRSR